MKDSLVTTESTLTPPNSRDASKMKILTANFVTCAVKSCKASPAAFPLHFQDAELEQADIDFNPVFLRNILPRIEWEALRTTAAEVCAFLLLKTCFIPRSFAWPLLYWL